MQSSNAYAAQLKDDKVHNRRSNPACCQYTDRRRWTYWLESHLIDCYVCLALRVRVTLNCNHQCRFLNPVERHDPYIGLYKAS